MTFAGKAKATPVVGKILYVSTEPVHLICDGLYLENASVLSQCCVSDSVTC